MKISIIIVSYKSDNVLKDCLFSIEKNNDLPIDSIEVIIVDNYENSMIVNMINEIRKNVSYSIKYIMNKANGGFGQGNNIGTSVSSGEVLFFLNADTRLLEPLFKMTYQKVANDNQLIVGYTLVDEKLQLNNSYSVFPQYYIFHVFFSLIKKLAFYLPNRVPFLNKMIWPWGAAFSMKRELFENSGCFDEQIFLCNEEPDLLMRIPCRKIKILRKKIIHLEGHTISKKIDRHLEYLKSTHYYFKKYGYNWSFFLWYTIFCSKIKRIFNNNSVHKELIDALNIYNS